MKNLTIAFVALALLAGCADRERFVTVAEQSIPKTVAIQVVVMVEQVTIEWGLDGLTSSTTTVPMVVGGSGVFVSNNGHVLTCEHLFDTGKIMSVTVVRVDGTMQGAEILERDAKKDLALIRVEGPTPHFARIADPRKMRVGQEVIAVGSPLGLDFSVSHGIISALNRDFSFRYNATQSDAPINPGNSGGPLFNLKGELVGINSFMIPPIEEPVFTGLGFSTSSGQIVEFLTRIRVRYEALPRFKLSYWNGFYRALGFN